MEIEIKLLLLNAVKSKEEENRIFFLLRMIFGKKNCSPKSFSENFFPTECKMSIFININY